MQIAIIIIILICICAGVAQMAEGQEKKAADDATAKRPDALKRLLSEEFRDFSDDFTFARCEVALKTFEAVSKSAQIRNHLTVFGNKWKSSGAEAQAASVYAQAIAPIFSDRFGRYAAADPLTFWRGFSNALNSSKTLAGGS